MKLGSLFDGSGGFPLAGTLCGITPIWAAEVEPYPIAVTRSRFPKMKHLGDVSKVRGDAIEPVDIITFGSPCQDLSVAGKRAGLRHEGNGDGETTRSGLFMEAVRIIKEMRKATNGLYPRFAVWENVPGAFSSNKGEDFRTVLEELIKIVEPDAVMPAVPKNGWAYADCYCGDGWSLAYRVFDAQYWGVPQRRRRIYLVADFRGECAGKVLFERKGLRGYSATGGTPWQGTAGDAEDCPGAAECERKCYGATGFTPKQQLFIIDSIGGQAERGWEGDVAHCLKATHYKNPPAIAQTAGFCAEPYENSQSIVRYLTPTECARLQGFLDRWGHIDEKNEMSETELKFWTDVRNTRAAINGKAVKEYTEKQMLTWYNKLDTDSAEYKMWGNGIALPTALYVLQGIAGCYHVNELEGEA